MRGSHFAGGLLVALSLAGCPVTDDYYIQSSASPGGAGGSGAGGSGGSEDVAGIGSGGAASGSGGQLVGSTAGSSGSAASAAGSDVGGTSSVQGGADAGGAPAMASGGVADAGAPAGGQPADVGQAGAAGAAGAPCVVTTERCNGRDDDCDGVVDDLVCNTGSTSGCVGFALPSDPSHGYMLCSGQTANQAKAINVCAGQDMHLAWLETSDENDAVSEAIVKLNGNATEVLFGASDQAKESDWIWPGNGGFQFWKGNDKGQPVNGAFNAWDDGTPNDANNSEDCGILYPERAAWGDRSCFTNFPFVCEDTN